MYVQLPSLRVMSGKCQRLSVCRKYSSVVLETALITLEADYKLGEGEGLA